MQLIAQNARRACKTDPDIPIDGTILVSGAAQSIKADEFWFSIELATSTELFGVKIGGNFWDDFRLSIFLFG